MPVTGNEGGPISNADAQAWIASFQATYPNETKSHLFGMNKINILKAQTGTMGLRFYNALDGSSAKKLIIYAVNSNGDGISGNILEYAVQCPPTCGQMTVTGDESATIPSPTAVTWIASFKNTYPNEIWAHLFGINIANNVFAQAGIKGLRVYNALNQGVKKIILYGVDASNNNLTTYIAEYALPCPALCGRP